jgi:amino acid adenylation domain-containing protein
MINQPDIQKPLLDLSHFNPDKKAIVCNDQYISYSEHWDIVTSLTKELKRVGIRKGDFVAVHMSNSIEMVVSIFAILNCNAIVIPVNIDLPHEQITRILTESNPKMILYNDHARPEIKDESILTYCVKYTELKKNNPSENELIIYDPKDLAYCIFTSGSSGVPKGVLLTYEGIINHIEAKISLLNLTCESRLCLSFNIGFVASVWQILTPILLGAQLFIYDNDLIKKPYQFLEQLECDEMNVVSMIPHSLYGYFQYIGDKHQKLALSNMKQIILTGEKVDRIVAETFYKEYDHISLINAYGQSECSDDTFHYEIPKNFIAGDIPIGKPIQNISYHILNETLEEVADEEKGELYIGGICLSQCYLSNEQLTRDEFVTISDSAYYRTGDIVKQNENKDVVCLGRIDNQIKIRGYRVEPEEIEAHLNQIAGIKQSVVIALETNKIDKILGVYYVSEINIDSKDIVNYLSAKLPSYMIPSVFKRVEKFIENANGKIDRKKVLECTEVKSGDAIPDISVSDELNDVQKKAFKVIIANLSEKVSDNVSLDMDFNSIGLDSITFIKIIVALECEFDFEFDDEMLLITKFPTVKSMVEYVESKATSN